MTFTVITIREGIPADLNQLFLILHGTIELKGRLGMEEPLYTEEFVHGFLTDKEHNLVLVAEENGKILGFIFAEIWKKKKYSYLEDIAILPEHQGRGLGSLLYKEYEQKCKEIGLKNLCAIVQTTNDRMHHFCSKIGFNRGRDFAYYEKSIT